MSQTKISVKAAPLVIGVLLAWSITTVSPVFAQRSGGGGHRGGGGGHSGGGGFHGGGGMSAARGGPSHGPGISGGRGFSRGSGSFSRGTGHTNRSGISGGGHYPGSSIPQGIAPTHAGPHYGRYPDSRYSHGGRVPSSNSFYLFLGHKKAAREELSQAVALEARDQLAAELLAMAGGAPTTPPGDSLPLPPPAEESTVPDSTPEPIPAPPAAEQG